MLKYKTLVFFLFVLLLVLFSVSGTFSHGVWKPDEPRVAEIGREMWLNHQYVIPTLNKKPFLEKPPLYWWVMSASYELFGVSDGAARLPSALFGFLTLLFTYLIGKRVGGEKTGMYAALVLATLTEFSIVSHRCLVDNALFFFVTLGYYGFFLGFPARSKKVKWIGYELMAIASGLAFLSKGVVGPGLIVIPPFLALIVTGNFREFRKIAPQAGVGALLFALIVAPWITGLYLEGGKPALKEYLLQNTLGRMLPSAIRHYSGGHKHSFFYYFAKLPQDFIPWIIALPATLVFLIRPPASLDGESRKNLAQVLFLFVAGFLLLSIPQTKRGLYVLPLYPLLAVVIGGWLTTACHLKHQASTLERWTLMILLGVFAAVPLGVAVGAIIMVLTGVGPKGVPMGSVIRKLTPMLPLIVPLGIITFLLLAGKLRKSFKTNTAPSCLLIFSTVILFLFVYHEGATRMMDPAKNFHLITEKMRPYLDEHTPIAGFKPSELTRGIIPFDTGKYIKAFNDPEKLVRYLRQHPQALLVIQEKTYETLPVTLKRHLDYLSGQDYSRRFRIRIYRLKEGDNMPHPSIPEPHGLEFFPSPGERT